MPINPGISLGLDMGKPLDMLGAYGKAMSIKDLVDSAKLREMQGQSLQQKMQFDAQDQALDLAGKRVTIGQKLASGLLSLPPEQRASQYPAYRNEYIRLTGDASAPTDYDEAHITRWALLGQSADKMREATREEARQIALAQLQGDAMGGAPAPGGITQPSAPAGEVGIDMQPDGGAQLTAPTISVTGQTPNPATLSDTHATLLQRIMSDPRLAGTNAQKDALAAYLSTKKEEEESPGRGLSFQTGPSGERFLFRNDEMINGGRPLDMGFDVNKPFRPGRDAEGNDVAVPNMPYQKFKLSDSAAGAARVDVNTGKEQDESSKVIGKGYGEQYTQIQGSEFASRKRLGRAERLEQLLDGVHTGKLTPLGTQLAGYANALGFEIDPKLGNKEAAIALESEMALELRNPAGGAGMPGAMSDSDRKFLEGMSSFTNKTPQGRKFMMETYRAIAKRDAEIAKLARDYKKRNGGKFDEGFYDEIGIWSAAHPMFPDADAVAKEKARRGLK